MPSWWSPTVAWGAGAAILIVALLVSFIQPKVFDLVWRRLAGSVVAAATRQSRDEQQQATAAADREVRIRSAMATIRTGLITWSSHSGVAKTSLVVAQILTSIHRGVAELRTEEPRAKAELDAILAVADRSQHVALNQAQDLLAALEAKVRELH